MSGAIIHETDLSLLRRFTQAGDHAAFSEIVRRYAGMVFSTCHRVLHDAAKAEDAAQETFFRLMRRPEAVSLSLGAWLHTAAVNLALDSLRSESARQQRETEYARDVAADREEADHETTRWADLSPKIDRAMLELKDGDRLLLIAHFLQGRPQNELAAAEKVSAATMSRRIRTAAEALQRKLQGNGLNLSPLALIGLLHDHSLQAVPISLSAELGKMTMMTAVRNLSGGAAVLSHPPIAWIAVAIVLISLGAGAIAARLGNLTPHSYRTAPQIAELRCCFSD